MKIYDVSIKGFRQEYEILIGKSRQEYTLFVDDLPNNFGMFINHKIPLFSNSLSPRIYKKLDNTRIENGLYLRSSDITANKLVQTSIQNGLELKHSIYIGGDYTISLPENRLALSSLLSLGRDRIAIPSQNTLSLTVSVSPKKSQNISVEENILKLRSDIYLSGQMIFQLEPNILSLTSSLEVLYEGSGSGSGNLYTWEKWDGEPGAISIGDETSVVLATKSTTASGSSTITYANSYSVIDNEIVLDNPSDEVSISAAPAGANTANDTFIGKYIRRSYTYKNPSASQENTVVDFYYVGTNANATYTATNQYVPSLGGTVKMSGVQLIKTSTFIEYVTSEASDSYPDNGMQDGYWYVKCGDSNVSVTKLSDIDENSLAELDTQTLDEISWKAGI